MFYYLLVLLCLYLLTGIFLYLYQEKLIFRPDKLPTDYQFDFPYPFDELNVKVNAKTTINCLWFKSAESKGCVLYHHGNARNLTDWASNFNDFVKNGYDVFFYDYRGYGKSTGKIGQGALHKDAMKVYKYLLNHYPKEKIIQYGISLGSGVATRLAYRIKSPLLILVTPYRSMLDMAKLKMPFFPHDFILKYPLKNYYFIRKVRCPIYLFHGDSDELIPYKHSVALSKLNPRIDFTTIVAGMHNNLPTFGEYQKKLAAILKNFDQTVSKE